jgi:DNA-binding MarR family transcriptional regulator
MERNASGSTEASDAELVGQLHGFVKYLLHSHGDDYARALAELELSLTQLRVLHVLTDDADQASLKELSEQIGISLPAVSRAVDGLVQRELVTRAEDTTDRRMKQVRATPAAAGLVERLMELRLAGIDEFVSTLSPRERARLTAAMALLAERDEIASRCARMTKPRSRRRKDAA